MEAKLTIQERLKDLRVVDRGLSLEQLAEQTGLSKSLETFPRKSHKFL